MRGSTTTGEEESSSGGGGGHDRRRPECYGASNGGGSVVGGFVAGRTPLPPPPSMTLPPPPHMGGRRQNGNSGGGGYGGGTVGVMMMAEEEEEDCFVSSSSSSGYGGPGTPMGKLPPPPRMSSSSVPGRARRRGVVASSSSGSAIGGTSARGGRKRSDVASSYWARRIRSFLGMRTGKGRRRRGGGGGGGGGLSALDDGDGVDASSPGLAVTLAVVAWFLLGVISIATTKILLSDVGVGPLTLSVQQFGIGTALLGVILRHRDSCSFRAMSGMNKSPSKTRGNGGGRRSVGGLAPPPTFDAAGYASGRGVGGGSGTTGGGGDGPTMELFLTGFFFASGFVATNYSFRGSAASFVETVKAAEPITSAIVAVTWGVDTVGPSEAMSLLSVVLGVILSTVGNSFYLGLNSHRVPGASRATSVPSLSMSVRNCLVVMIANLCFSFRGLHQKLLRSTAQGSTSVLDDVKLQYRMQQLGVGIFILPALLLECPSEIKTIYAEAEILISGRLYRYISLSLANGFAFATYNLASTYVLTRLSVVHHAALNCVRRIFAIVVTSILFGVRLGLLGSLGVIVSFVGFMSYTRSKMKRQNKPRPLSSLLPMSAV